MTTTATPLRPGPAVAGDRAGASDAWPTPRRADRRVALLMGAAVLAGFALRAAVGLTDDAPSTDETAYLRSGMSLVDGDGFQRDGQPELHFPPFVPFLLGLASRVFADPHTGTVVLTCLAGTALVLPLAMLGRRIAGPVAGVVTAWVAALGPGLSTTLVNRGAGSEAEYLLLVATALWLTVAAADRQGAGRLARVAGAGLLVGLAFLTRPEGLVVAVPVGAAAIVLAGRGRWRSGPGRVRSVAPTAAAFAVPVLACVGTTRAATRASSGPTSGRWPRPWSTHRTSWPGCCCRCRCRPWPPSAPGGTAGRVRWRCSWRWAPYRR